MLINVGFKGNKSTERNFQERSDLFKTTNQKLCRYFLKFRN